jgi:hypothetical protein
MQRLSDKPALFYVNKFKKDGRILAWKSNLIRKMLHKDVGIHIIES